MALFSNLYLYYYMYIEILWHYFQIHICIITCIYICYGIIFLFVLLHGYVLLLTSRFVGEVICDNLNQLMDNI